LLDRTGVVWIINITETAHCSVAFQNNSSILITPFSIYLKLISQIGGPHGARSAFKQAEVSPVFAYELEGMNVLRVLEIQPLNAPSGTANVALIEARDQRRAV